MKRGDVYLADLDPVKGSEQAGRPLDSGHADRRRDSIHHQREDARSAYMCICACR